MSEKSPRRLKLEDSLAEQPGDPFLRYALAMQCLADGAREEGRGRLLALITDHPDDQIAAYQQLAQSYLETDEEDLARLNLVEGINRAKAQGNLHAAAEMEDLLAQMG